MTIERLTALDAGFLHMERDGLPLHVASVATFEGAPLLDEDGRLPLEELRSQVVARLASLPRFRRRLAWTPFGIARPCWVDDPDFDVTHHVDAVDLGDAEVGDTGEGAGDGLAGLRRLAEQLVAERLPYDRPLWHLRFVTGLPGGRVGMIERVHHALVDGVSGVDVATVLLDLTPDALPVAPQPWTSPPAPGPLALLAGGVADRAATTLRLARAAAANVSRPLSAIRSIAATADAVAALAGDGLFAPRSLLNVPTGADRRLAWIGVRLDEVRRAGKDHDATVNDVVLCAVAHGLRALLLERGEVIDGGDILKVLVPVSVRGDAERGSLGNRVGALLLPLPIGLGDPTERLEAIAATTKRLKARREATAVDGLLTAAGFLPAALDGPIARLTGRQPFVNVVVTNVPGPPVPLYCRGARMLDAFPVVPLGGNLPLGVAILSYDGALNVSITADGAAFPDLDTVRLGIEEGFAAVGATWRPRLRQGSVA
jgi:WS/DGAT/MGAT family acyltransferase